MWEKGFEIFFINKLVTTENMELEQFDLNFNRFKYRIEETGIRLIKKGISSSSDTFVDFEDIGSKVILENTRKLILLFISILFLIAAIGVFIKRFNGGEVEVGAEIFHLAMSAIFFITFLLTKKNILFLAKTDNTNAIEFLGTKRDKKKVEDFINILLRKRDNFIINKYSTLDKFLPYNQQYNNLVWLYNLSLLSKEQLQIKINELDQIDFNNYNSNRSDLLKIVKFSDNSDKDNKTDLDENGGDWIS